MRVVVLLALSLTLAGCFGSGPSRTDMQAEVEEAIRAFADDVGPGGDLQLIDVSGDVSVESEFNGQPVTVTIQPVMEVRLGTDGDVLVDGRALALRFTAYCDAQRLIAITTGGEAYDVPDTSAETRNTFGACSGPGSEAIVLEYFDFPNIDPSLMTGDLRLDEMEPQGFEEVGKGTYAGTYTVEGDEGTTTLTITAKGGRVTKIVSHNPDAHLVLEMTYGERTALEAPEADLRLPTRVVGTQKTDSTGWTWSGIEREGGPIGEYRLDVHPAGTAVPCGGADPTVSFDLGAGADQVKDGWRLLVLDDGDGTLGDGDKLDLRQPSGMGDFDHKVTIHDTWADQRASFACTPGPGAGLVLVVPILAALIARRRP